MNKTMQDSLKALLDETVMEVEVMRLEEKWGKQVAYGCGYIHALYVFGIL